ncbi:MAG: sulfurtransferase-like selenium metabolism protein YedF [Fusobacteriaceae bacterium]
MKTVDALGKLCPIPIIMTKNALKEIESGEVLVLIDNEISVQNLEKFCVELKMKYDVVKEESHFKFRIIKEKNNNAAAIENYNEGNIIVVIESDTMGRGDEELGKTLLKNFIYTLTELEELPQKIIMYNRGVFMAVEDTTSAGDLKKLQEMGVEIYCCGACANYYHVTEQIKVGTITNMYNILNMQMKGEKIIKP